MSQRNPEHETKHFAVSVKDAEKGMVEAVFSTFDVVDLDGDVTLPDAFEDGAKVAISAYGHASWGGAKPVGKGVIRVEKDRAVLDGQFFMDTIEGAETFKTIKNMGELQEYSYGFDVLDTDTVTEDMRKQGVRRVLKKLKVYEVSPVFRGAGIATQTLAVKAVEPTPAEPTDEEKQSRYEITAKGRQELARFIQTMTRLAR